MATKCKNVGKCLTRGHDPVGLHVKMDKYLNGEVRTLLGTVKAVAPDRSIPGVYQSCLIVHHFNGEEWPVRPHPSVVEII
jgi:hypothetical protein